MQSTAYAVPAGHVLRVAVSPTYWPWAWPSPEPVTLTVDSGGESRLELPVRGPSALDGALRAFDPPEAAPPLAEETKALGRTGRVVHRDLAAGSAHAELRWIDSRSVLVASATELAERNVVRYGIVEGDPLSAEVSCAVDVELARGAWRTRVEVRSEMTCDRDRFVVSTALDAYEGSVRRFTRRWAHAIDRDGG
jgi:hypothetical protein